MKLKAIFEAAVSNANLAMPKIISYLEKHLGEKLIKVPAVEHFSNSKETGFGLRYIVSGTTKCLRFNWSSDPSVGNSNSIVSVDIFSGKSRNPSFNIEMHNISFANSLPTLVSILKSPTIGVKNIFPVSSSEALSESIIFEAKMGDYTTESALKDFLQNVTNGSTFTRSDFIAKYHIIHAGIFDTVMNDFKDFFDIKQKRISLKEGTKPLDLMDNILAKGGIVEVTKGGSDEEFLKTKQEEAIDDKSKVKYEDALTDLEGLVSAIISGASNALFISGKGGTGKTQTVEHVLHSHGLSDGHGYTKVSGTASGIGVFSLLYHNRNNIVVFDDSDGALADQDARNIIKTATDTKKVRKLSWSKKSSFLYDPSDFNLQKYADDPEMVPRSYNFEGQIIFISNLPLNKLDPDGALRTRAFVICIDPSDDELLDHMGKILNDIKLEEGLHLTEAERLEVFDMIKSSSRKGGLSLRKLVRSLNLKASGAPNWERLCELYA